MSFAHACATSSTRPLPSVVLTAGRILSVLLGKERLSVFGNEVDASYKRCLTVALRSTMPYARIWAPRLLEAVEQQIYRVVLRWLVNELPPNGTAMPRGGFVSA